MPSLLRTGLPLLALSSLACSIETDGDPLLDEQERIPPAAATDRTPDAALTAAPDPSQDAAGFTLDLTKDGHDLVLDWDAQPDGATYEVWASDVPDFAPQDAVSVLLAGGLSEPTYVHVGGNDAQDRYYRVRVEGETAVTNAAGAVVTALLPGYTKIGRCMISDLDTTEELFDDLESGAVSAHLWDAKQQHWATDWSADIDLLELPMGGVVSIHHDEGQPVVPSTYSWVGRVPVEGDVVLPLRPGDNLVTMLPTQAELAMASDVLAAVDHATRVGYWDAQAQTTHWYPDGPDFETPACAPIHVEVDENSVWPPLHVRETIGPEGGSISAYSGTVQLQFPAGALTEPTEISVTPYGYPVEGGYVPTFALEPHDIEFEESVQLTLRYRPGFVPLGADEELVDLIRYSTDGSSSLLGATNDLEAGTLTTSLETFSWIGTVRLCSWAEPTSVGIFPADPVTYTGQILPLGAVPFNIIGIELPTRDASWGTSNPGVANPSSGQALSLVAATGIGLARVDAHVDACVTVPVSTGVLIDVAAGFFPGIGRYVRSLARQLDIWPYIDVDTTVPVGGSTFVSVQDPTCAAVDCPENGNVCTQGCAGGICGDYPVANGSPCPDEGGLFGGCTADVCDNGTCSHPPDPVCLFALCFFAGICGV